MDRGDKDDLQQEKRNQELVDFSSSGMPSDWRFCSTNGPMSLVDSENPLASCNMGSSSCSSAPMMDSFYPRALWDQPNGVQNIGYCDISLQSNLSSMNPLEGLKPSVGPSSLRVGDVSWNPPVSLLKEGLFFPGAPLMLSESLSQFPADSGFIERAARFSCFSGGGFTDMVNPFGGIEETGGVCSREGSRVPVPMQGEVFPFDPMKLLHSQRNIFNSVEASKDAGMSSVPGNCGVGQLKTEDKSEGLVQSNDGAQKQVGGSVNDSEEQEFSGSCGQVGKEEKGVGSKKRKRNGPDASSDRQHTENVKDAGDAQPKFDQKSPNSGSGKADGKNTKHGSQASEPPKEEYIHIRARRGQATNSHSLAERVRREKISERMKFLQDLVPGCSKVTGKAVMLDEIINYVQSLQRQVEFLSMRLATVNPRLDFNFEELLAKDILHPRGPRPGPSSTLGFFPDMPMLYPSPVPPAGLIQTGLNGIGSPDGLRRSLHNQINSLGCGGFKESAQLPDGWGDELNNVVQVGFNGNTPLSTQDNSDGSVQPSHAKLEP